MNVDCIIGMSVDGRIDWIKDPNTLQEIYYGIVMSKQYDAMICGSNTMLQAQYDESNTQKYTNQTLVVIDSKGKIGNWSIIKKQAWWNDSPIVLCSKSTPEKYIEMLHKEKINTVVTGDDQINLKEAIEILEERYNIKKLRIDSGGILLGKMLRNNLVNTITTIIMPQLTGGRTPKTIFVDEDIKSEKEIIDLKILKHDVVKENYIVVTYEIIR